MRAAGFTLVPFTWPQEPYPSLTGELAITDGVLRVEYDLRGLNSPASFPAALSGTGAAPAALAPHVLRTPWGPLHDPTYWELNASPPVTGTSSPSRTIAAA